MSDESRQTPMPCSLASVRLNSSLELRVSVVAWQLDCTAQVIYAIALPPAAKKLLPNAAMAHGHRSYKIGARGGLWPLCATGAVSSFQPSPPSTTCQAIGAKTPRWMPVRYRLASSSPRQSEVPATPLRQRFGRRQYPHPLDRSASLCRCDNTSGFCHFALRGLGAPVVPLLPCQANNPHRLRCLKRRVQHVIPA